MTPKLFLRFFLVLLSVLPSSALADNLDGLWQVADQPVQVKIHQAEAALHGTVHSAKNAQAIGKVLLKDFKEKEGVWWGMIYVARFGEFKKASLTALNENTLEITVKVGFMSRSVQWQRVKTNQEQKAVSGP